MNRCDHPESAKGMQTNELNLQPGEFVEVRAAAEILGALDDDGSLEGLPFMPEMLAFCGHRFRVYRRAHKTCDTIDWSGLRGMDRAVHLEALRCDGSAHGGCQAGCLLFWKEAWLRRDDPGASDVAPPGGLPAQSTVDPAPEAWLRERIRRNGAEGRFRCQATELRNATYPLSVLNAAQYVCDVRANGATWGGALLAVLRSAFNRLLKALRLPAFPRAAGRLNRTPRSALGLEPGEWVEVKSHREILATLDRQGKNRGLSFDAEMVPYCGGRFRVLRRVERIVDEKTGELRTLPGPCLVLDGVVCRGLYHRLCPRGTFPYWREIWLRRVSQDGIPSVS
jgi:hypothetical protein